MRVVGRRKDRPSRLSDAASLQRLAADLRRIPTLARRGVYRFGSFEEADRWMIETIAASSASPSSKTSSGSAAR